MAYPFQEIEKKWQDRWAGKDKEWSDEKTFSAENNSPKPKYYVLDMFPYPSGSGLHVGHPLGYIASDIVARYKRLMGFNVLHPMGYDSFGLPAEQYAIQTGQHPAITTEKNIARYREQMDKIGFSFDWERAVRTSDPNYYKWTQWIFLKLFNSWYNPETAKAEPIEKLIQKFSSQKSKVKVGEAEKNWNDLNEKQKSALLMNYRLAYLNEAWVNWCPQLGTVLANEEVKDGVSERGGYPVERKLMPQWSLRITAYSERLLKDLEKINWSESIKESQRNWIGRSEGCSLKFKIQNSELEIEVFTTRPDTIFGVTFLTLAPENELVPQLTISEQKQKVEAYLCYAKNRSERERQADVKKVTGEFIGSFAIHPFTGEKIPIWIGEYVLAGYGTGAVMGVPAHDTRDFAFAKHFGLEIKKVIVPNDKSLEKEECFDTYDGKCINSDMINGLEVKNAIKKIISEIEKRNLGKGKTQYRLRDAIFGRQRYWGEPIPVYYENGIPKAVDEADLPVILPDVDKYLPTETGEPPLARARDWKYKGKFDYEKTTMPGWAGSSWYYLRYMDAKNEKEFVSKDAVNYWQNVDLYIGGAEHATGHLLYVRFWTKFLHDLGYLPFDEPAKKLINQGMIQGTSMFAYSGGSAGVKVKRYIDGKKISERYGTMTLSGKDFKNNFTDSDMMPAVTVRIPVDYVIFQEGKYYLTQNNLEKLKIEHPKFTNAILENESERIELFYEAEKMSKSKFNVVTPDEICEKYGADTLRMYEMFLGPLEQSKPWNTNGISGVHNFLNRFWRLFHSPISYLRESGCEAAEDSEEAFTVSDDAPAKPELKTLHKTIIKIQQDIENYSFNTAISAFMICVNELTELKCNKRKILEPLVILLSPFAPHIAEELWEKLRHCEGVHNGKKSISFADFPVYDESLIAEDSFAYPVSFNGKMRFNLELPLYMSSAEIEKEVLAFEQTKKYLGDKKPKKIIVIPKRIVNIVV